MNNNTQPIQPPKITLDQIQKVLEDFDFESIPVPNVNSDIPPSQEQPTQKTNPDY